ncbi:myosin heavy chain, striated muscle-like [Dysidea avara]|uniref:myosin heavy chain, striated muscle-like n=1 Tax=Dysidea avara TaxID=196820 RepID=UPI00332BC05F
MADRKEIREDVDKVTRTPEELKERLLSYGEEETWKISVDKVKAREFLDEDFETMYHQVKDAATNKAKALAKKLLPTLEKVLSINKKENATVYKASELLENVEPLLKYSYIAEEYDFQLEGRCRRILDQYDTTYKEVIGFRCKTEMDKVDAKTTECLTLLEESIKAAEEDIVSLQRQMTTEHGQIGMADVTERDSVAKKLIDEENDELKLIQSNCTRDLQTIERKLDEVDKKVKSVSMERGLQKKQLENSLNKNRQEQEQLRARLSQLEEEDRDLTGRINRNNELQAAAEKEHNNCNFQVKKMGERIENLLAMTNASLELMKDMTGCMQDVVNTAGREKKRILNDLEQKSLQSNLQLRDALIAKIIFHQIQADEMTVNLNETSKEISDMEKDLRTAAKTNNSSRVKRLKESLNSMEGEKVQFSERKALHMKELEVLQKRREQVDKELHAGGITQLPTIQQRIQTWKQEQDKCFDNPETGSFHSNISHL